MNSFQSIKEKKKFVKAPVNFAVEKNRLLVLKAGAEGRGDYVLAEEIQKEISELDARAFDKVNGCPLLSFSWSLGASARLNILCNCHDQSEATC